MTKRYGAGKRRGPYEILRARFLMLIKRKARIIRRVKSWRARRDYLRSVIHLAKTIDNNDIYTRGHCEKVMKYSILIGRLMGLTERQIKTIKTAAILHDIGKIGIDLNILRKPEKLTEDDWKKIRLHPQVGAKIAGESVYLKEATPIIMHHHARYSGGGYPDAKLRAEEIPVEARIIAVADAYDAMTSDRPYRSAMPREAAVAELNRCSGQQFDPKIVSAFIHAA